LGAFCFLLESLLTFDAAIFCMRKGRGCVKEKPFAGFSFASSEADNPPVGGGSRREPGTK